MDSMEFPTKGPNRFESKRRDQGASHQRGSFYLYHICQKKARFVWYGAARSIAPCAACMMIPRVMFLRPNVAS